MEVWIWIWFALYVDPDYWECIRDYLWDVLVAETPALPEPMDDGDVVDRMDD